MLNFLMSNLVVCKVTGRLQKVKDREENLCSMFRETALNTPDISEENCGTVLKNLADVKKYGKSSQ